MVSDMVKDIVFFSIHFRSEATHFIQYLMLAMFIFTARWH